MPLAARKAWTIDIEAGEWTIAIKLREDTGALTVEAFESCAELIARLRGIGPLAASHHVTVHAPARTADEDRRTIRDLGFTECLTSTRHHPRSTPRASRLQ